LLHYLDINETKVIIIGKYEAIGLFYAAFLFLGVSVGLGIGFLTSHLILGGILGATIGIGLGLLSNAFIALKHDI